MAAKKGEDTIHKTQEFHSVKCKLTVDAKAEAAMQLAEAYTTLESLAIEKKTAMTEFKQRKEKIEEQVHVLSLKVKSGFEPRDIKCELQLNYTKLRATLIRLDTHDIVEERDMTADEKQMKLQEKKKNTKKSMKESVKTEELKFEETPKPGKE